MKYEALNQKILEMQEEIIGAVQESIRIDSIKGAATICTIFFMADIKNGNRKY